MSGCGHSLDSRRISARRRASAGTKAVRPASWCTSFSAQPLPDRCRHASGAAEMRTPGVKALSLHLHSPYTPPPSKYQRLVKSCAFTSRLFPSHAFPFAMATRTSLSSVSSPHCAYVSSFREPSHSSSPSPNASETPSIYVTFKVLQLVNSFRSRVTRKLAPKKVYARKEKTTAQAQDFCQDFERQAFDEIDRYLGRKTRRPSSKRPKVTEDTRPSHFAGAKEPQEGKSIDRYGIAST